LAATLNATLPLPVPPVAVVNEIHDALLCDVHEQPAVAVTEAEPDPPFAATEEEEGLIENEHEPAA
jgi:hypothetical protein